MSCDRKAKHEAAVVGWYHCPSGEVQMRRAIDFDAPDWNTLNWIHAHDVPAIMRSSETAAFLANQLSCKAERRLLGYELEVKLGTNHSAFVIGPPRLASR